MIRGTKDLAQTMEELLKQAYQRGWDDATAALIAAARAGAVADPAPTKTNGAEHPSISEIDAHVTAREAVERALRARPGMHSSEIHKWVVANGMQIKFEAVRTAIKRGTRKGDLVRFGTGYGLKPAAAVERAS
jgi:hypothetical protein